MSDVKVKFGAEDENLTSTLNKVQKELKQVESQANNTSTNFQGGFSKMAAAGAVAGVAMAAFTKAIDLVGNAINVSFGYIKGSVDDASNLGETVSKVGVIFGDSAQTIKDWSKTSADALGQSRTQAMDAAATFAVFGKSAGLTGEKLAGFSTGLVELSADLASFSNSTPEEAILAIGSALRGEAEPMRRFGVLLDDASLRNEALKMGLIATTKEALTPQQKVLAAHALILAQTSDAQGDFARTSDGLANQSRISAAKIEDLSTKIGQILLPAATEMTKAFNEMLVPAMNQFANLLSGIDTKGWGSNLINTIIKVADTFLGIFASPTDAIKAIGSTLNAGVRTFGSNLTNTIISGTDLLSGFFKSDLPSLMINQVGNAMTQTYAKSLEFLATNISKVARAFESDWGLATGKVISFMADGLKNVLKFFASDFMSAINSPLAFFTGKLTSGLAEAVTNGGLTFKSAFNEGIVTSLDRLSTGLNITAQDYSGRLSSGTAAIGAEFTKIKNDFTPSAENFFGAKEATIKMQEDFVKMQESGKKMRESWQGVNAEAQATNAAVNNIAFNSERTAAATKKTKDDMIEIKTISGLIAAQEKADDKETYTQRWKQAKKDAKDYEDYLGGDFSKRSIRDMSEAMGIEVAGKESGELLDEIEARMEGLKGIEIPLKMDPNATQSEIDQMNDLFAKGFKELELKIGTDEAIKTLNSSIGKKKFELDLDATDSIEEIKKELTKPIKMDLKTGDSASGGNATLEAIKTAVEVIRTLVAKIEPKLPQTALAQ